MDAEMKKFAEDLLESIRQAERGEIGRIHTPEQILARRTNSTGDVGNVGSELEYKAALKAASCYFDN